jgi:hypothetical protein
MSGCFAESPPEQREPSNARDLGFGLDPAPVDVQAKTQLPRVAREDEDKDEPTLRGCWDSIRGPLDFALVRWTTASRHHMSSETISLGLYGVGHHQSEEERKIDNRGLQNVAGAHF